MALFNPLDYPICFSYPLRVASTASARFWMEHIPFRDVSCGRAAAPSAPRTVERGTRKTLGSPKLVEFLGFTMIVDYKAWRR
jgi:hypothetical protein